VTSALRRDAEARISTYRQRRARPPSFTFAGGENCNLAVAAGDVVEILGIQATIQSVDSATQVTLTAAWTGERLQRSRSISSSGNAASICARSPPATAFEPDLSLYPPDTYADILLDGNLSFPVTPVLALASGGNVVRVTISGVVGTLLDKVLLYRAEGVDVTPNANFRMAMRTTGF